MALLHGATALRSEEAFGLRWSDVKWDKGEILLRRGWSKGEETDGKNKQSMAPIAMHPALATYLQRWREQSLYPADSDWIFPSLKLKGKKPRAASVASQDYLRPAAVMAGIIEKGTSKCFGGHNLRHSLATFLSGEVDAAVTMKVLRHKRLATVMEIYTHRVNSQQQAAQGMYLAAIGHAQPGVEATNAGCGVAESQAHDGVDDGDAQAKRRATPSRSGLFFAAQKRKSANLSHCGLIVVPTSNVTCHKPLIHYGLYGGDDGARTRGLCRDRAAL
jgi:hypothetical protein